MRSEHPYRAKLLVLTVARESSSHHQQTQHRLSLGLPLRRLISCIIPGPAAIMPPLSRLLRPLATPRHSACQQLSRFSSVPHLRTSAPSTPQAASRAADLAAAEATIESDNPNPAAPKPTLPSQRSPPKPFAVRFIPPIPELSLPPPRYHVSRSNSNNMPVYTDYKRGGNLRITRVRKITGDLSALRDELREYLQKEEKEVTVNRLTQQVVVKVSSSPLLSGL